MAKNIRCIDCGMLAYRASHEGRLRSLPKGYRDTISDEGFEHHLLGAVFCSANALRESTASNEQARVVYSRVKNCGDFFRHIPALLTPKEHLEMGLLADQREINARLNKEMARATIKGAIIGGIISFLGGLAGGAITVLYTR